MGSLLTVAWQDPTFIQHVMSGLKWALDGGSTRAYGQGLVGSGGNGTVTSASATASGSVSGSGGTTASATTSGSAAASSKNAGRVDAPGLLSAGAVAGVVIGSALLA